MRRALVVGIDFYTSIDSLFGCVNDSHSVKAMLERHADGSVNFGTKLMTGTGPNDILTRSEIKEAARTLFSDGDGEVALFYFAGHGYIETTGGYLCGGDCQTGDDGLALQDIMVFANSSKFRNRIIILDSCHSRPER
jgi:Caspase domain